MQMEFRTKNSTKIKKTTGERPATPQKTIRSFEFSLISLGSLSLSEKFNARTTRNQIAPNAPMGIPKNSE